MPIRRLIAVLLIAALLGTGLSRPREAHADDTALIIIGSIVGYFGIIFLATWWLRSTDSSFTESSVSPFAPGTLELRAARDREPDRLRIGPECAALRQGLSVVCW